MTKSQDGPWRLGLGKGQNRPTALQGWHSEPTEGVAEQLAGGYSHFSPISQGLVFWMCSSPCLACRQGHSWLSPARRRPAVQDYLGVTKESVGKLGKEAKGPGGSCSHALGSAK